VELTVLFCVWCCVGCKLCHTAGVGRAVWQDTHHTRSWWRGTYALSTAAWRPDSSRWALVIVELYTQSLRIICTFLPFDAVHKRRLCCRAMSVHLSVTFVYSVEMSKHILKLFSPSGRPTILVCRTKCCGNILTGTILTGALNEGGVGKNYDFWQISGFNRVLSMVRLPSVIHTAVVDHVKLVTLIAGKRHRLLFAGDGQRSVYDKKAQRYAEDNRTT